MISIAAAASTTGLLERNRTPLTVALVALFLFSPFIFLRYEYHDSWAWLYWLNSLRWFNFVTPCLELGGHHYMIGRPFMTAIICTMTVFGPEIDRVWIPKLIALFLLFGAGTLILAVFRAIGAGVGIGALALGSVLFLPGFILMIVMMVANAIAWAVFAAVLAGFLWWKLSCHHGHGIARSASLLLVIVVLLIVAMATYQIVAVLFFLPLLVAIVFTEEKVKGSRLFSSALGGALLFTVAAVCFVLAHKTLLVDYRYFFLSEDQVREAVSQERSVSLIASVADLEAKLSFIPHLISRILALWFISEHRTDFPTAASIFGVATLASIVVLAFRATNVWRMLAFFVVVGCFFGPFLVAHNSGNGLHLLERVKVFMQVPFVLLVWALVHRILRYCAHPLRLAAYPLAVVVAVGISVSWLTVMRARVIPNYFELQHIESRLRDAVRRDVKYFYVIRAEDNHLRATIGRRGGEELGRITSFYYPEYMVSAIMLEIEKKEIPRAIFTIGVDKVDTIPNDGRIKLVIDMRKFP